MKYIKLLWVAQSLLTKQIPGYGDLKKGRDTLAFETSPSSVFLHTDTCSKQDRSKQQVRMRLLLNLYHHLKIFQPTKN